MLSLLNSSRAVVPRTIWHSLLRQPHTRAAPVAVGSSATAQPPAGLRDTERSRRLKRARGMRSISSVGQSPFDFNPDSEGASLGEVVLCPKWGVDVLHDPLYNKGSAFLLEERERLHLRGLIPPREYTVEGLDPLTVQAHRVLTRYRTMPSDLSKYSFLTSLQDRNEVLFYRVLLDNIREMAPIIYTPTVGQACLDFNQIWRRSRGMYFSAKDRGHMHAMTWNWPIDDVQIIVVTDGSRILGLGDLGANGMGIPIGKLSLYTACAGIHPSRCLPVLIDVGTNNEKLRQDELYLGLQQPRITGADYDAVIDEFLRAVAERWPNACVQFEDFSNDHAEPILSRYRNEMLCFNDDIQGTGAVTLAAVLNAVRVIEGGRQTEPEAASRALSQQRILIVGAGSAGLGVANSLCTGMTSFGAVSREQALSRFLMYDAHGTLGAGRPGITAAQAPFVRPDIKDGSSLLDAIEQFKPTALIGLTGIGGLFREEHIRAMRKHCERPIIFPLSNPTSRAECTAQQAYEWTGGSAVFASGSPFAPVSFQGRTLTPAQANNMFTFPGIGLGAIASGALHITDRMLHSAAVALSRSVSEDLLKQGRIFPDIAQIRTVSENVAVAVATSAAKEDLASAECNYSDEAAVRKLLSRVMWNPRYGSMVARR